jgi:biotin synthase-related radical SAM superfamily protein
MKSNIVNTTNLAYIDYNANSTTDYPRPVLSKGETKNVNDKPFKNGNNTAKGVVSLQSSREINKTRYVIERSFTGAKTPAMLIEERVINENRNSLEVYSKIEPTNTSYNVSAKN